MRRLNRERAMRAPTAHRLDIHPSLEGPTMNDLDFHIGQLVIANRILANEGVVDAYGHVSIRHPRHPERYLLACSRSPELVERADIIASSSQIAFRCPRGKDANLQPIRRRAFRRDAGCAVHDKAVSSVLASLSHWEKARVRGKTCVSGKYVINQ
jgi:hypothetical protein